MIDLNGKTVLITGGSRGIGAACALLFARAGADVAITYRTDRKGAMNVASEVRLLGRKCVVVRADIAKWADCGNIVRKTMNSLRRIDILVNSAGIWEKGPIGELSPAQWQRTIGTNLTGTYNVIRRVVPVMKKQRYGRIINVASTAGQRGEPFHSHYAASKGGVIAMTKSLGVELIREGIVVNCVSPGWVDTDMVAGVLKKPSMRKEIIASIPRGKVATAREIAGPVLFLASDLSNHMVGAVVHVNGGSVLQG